MVDGISTQLVQTAFGYMRTITTANDKTSSSAGKILDDFRKLPPATQDEILTTASEEMRSEIELALSGKSTDVALMNNTCSWLKTAMQQRLK
jgi:hypothetical protein